MINAAEVPAEHLAQTKRMLRDALLARGWKVWFYDPRFPQLRVERPDGKVLELYSSSPPTTSYAAGMTANNKLVTQRLYESVKLPVPKTWLVARGEEVPAEVIDVLADGQLLVVKPLDAAHGNGVRVGIATQAELAAAVENARIFAEDVLVQEYITSAIDVRFMCIDFKCVAVLQRLPAEVVGDGVQTIKALITQENTSERRGENYKRELNVIPLDTAHKYLGERINDVPAVGEKVQVVGTANVGTGGTTRDVTDDVPTWLTGLAEKAARTSQLPVCGVDFLLQNELGRDKSESELHPVIIEVNKCPSLFIHETPTYGKPRPVVEKYIDYLATL